MLMSYEPEASHMDEFKANFEYKIKEQENFFSKWTALAYDKAYDKGYAYSVGWKLESVV